VGDLVGLGIIGVGAMGSIHAANLGLNRVPGATLVAVADVSPEAAESCAAQNGVDAHAETDSLLADSRVHSVIIATPAATHGDLIVQAAEAGKHVFTEKPFEISVEGSDRALAAVAKAGVKIQVGFHRRFDNSFAQARASIYAGRIGEPYVGHIISRDPVWRVPPKIGGLSGLLFDTTIHDFDMARFVLGEAQSLYAIGTPAVHKAGVPDTLIVVLHFENGALGTIENGQAVFGYDQRLEVFGSLGAITVDNERRDSTLVVDREGYHAHLPPAFFPERYAAAYVTEIQSFVDCIRTDGEPFVTGADGRAATILALAAQRSLDESRPVLIREIA
jgi:myo-inositol 2-dehydrogenase / D-chiro-inositol 1-dehydrogenase